MKYFFLIVISTLPMFGDSHIKTIIQQANSGRVLELSSADFHTLRKYCYLGKIDGLQTKAQALWALLQCEYTKFSSCHSQLERQAVAWYVKKAHQHFANHLQSQKLYGENWSLRLLVSYRYLDTANQYLPNEQDDLYIEQQVTTLLMQIFFSWKRS